MRGSVHFFQSCVVVLAISFGMISTAHGESATCGTLIGLLRESSKDDWTFHHGSTAAILGGNAALLLGTEAVRAATGQPAFNADFIANSTIDMVMTTVAQQVSMLRLPVNIQNRFSKAQDFWVRVGANTVIDSIIMVLMWKLEAMRRGATISVGEIAGAIVYCMGTYTTLQWFRDRAFGKWPKQLDSRFWTSLDGQGAFKETFRAEAALWRAVLTLGAPFHETESLDILQALAKRESRNRWLRISMATIDRILGGVIAGGLVMRQLTQSVLSR